MNLGIFTIVNHEHEYVVERLGKFYKIQKPGLNLKIPVMDQIVEMVDLREQVFDVPPQGVITKDNITLKIDTVIYLKIVDSQKFTYGINNAFLALENLAATTLRNIIGEMDLQETLTAREAINTKMSRAIDLATDPWGIDIKRVEIKTIEPPMDIREAMEKEMRAEREKRANILTAEGLKEKLITEAKGEADSLLLRARADKEAKILEAEGEAESIVKKNEAYSKALKILKDEDVIDAYLKIESYKALVEMSKNPSNKIIVPTDVTNATVDQTISGEMFLDSLKDKIN